MNLTEIISDWLVAHKCDGLFNDAGECGCKLDDLMACGELDPGCVAAQEGNPPEDADPDCDFWMYPIKEVGETTPEAELAELQAGLCLCPEHGEITTAYVPRCSQCGGLRIRCAREEATDDQAGENAAQEN